MRKSFPVFPNSSRSSCFRSSIRDGNSWLSLTTKLSDLARQGKRTLARQQAGGDLRAKEILDLRGGAKA